MYLRDLECWTINPCICNCLYRHLFLINNYCLFVCLSVYFINNLFKVLKLFFLSLSCKKHENHFFYGGYYYYYFFYFFFLCITNNKYIVLLRAPGTSRQNSRLHEYRCETGLKATSIKLSRRCSGEKV